MAAMASPGPIPFQSLGDIPKAPAFTIPEPRARRVISLHHIGTFPGSPPGDGRLHCRHVRA